MNRLKQLAADLMQQEQPQQPQGSWGDFATYQYGPNSPSTSSLAKILADTEVERGLFAPLVEYGDGRIEPGVPNALMAPARAITNMLAPGYDYGNTQQAAQDSFDAAGLISTGGLAGASMRPIGSIGMGGSGTASNALDMNQAARMQRAKDMGFDTDTVLYHGTPHEKFDEFKLGMRGASAHVGKQNQSDSYITFASEKDHAASYGDVYPFHARGNIKQYDASQEIAALAKANGYENTQKYIDDFGLYGAIGLDELLSNQAQIARKEGFDGVRIGLGGVTGPGLSRNYPIGGDVFAIFDPSKIRSTDAAFDPNKISSANLLAAQGTPAANAITAEDKKRR